MTPRELIETVERTGADGVQPYGREAPAAAEEAQRAGLQVLRPVRVSGAVDLEAVPSGRSRCSTPQSKASMEARVGHSIGT